MKYINVGDIVRVVGCDSYEFDSYEFDSYVGKVGEVVSTSFTGWAVQLEGYDEAIHFYPGEIAPLKWRVSLEVRGKGWFTVIAKRVDGENIKVVNVNTFERAVKMSRQLAILLNGWEAK